MDIEKLIEDLRIACARNQHNIMGVAATALSTLQAENKRLNKIVCSIPTTPDSGRTVSQYEKEMSMCAYLDDLEAENEKLRAELEQVKAERDAAVDELHGKCSVCSHYTPYHNDGPCASCKFEVACFVPEKATDKWEWRGIKED